MVIDGVDIRKTFGKDAFKRESIPFVLMGVITIIGCFAGQIVIETNEYSGIVLFVYIILILIAVRLIIRGLKPRIRLMKFETIEVKKVEGGTRVTFWDRGKKRVVTPSDVLMNILGTDEKPMLVVTEFGFVVTVPIEKMSPVYAGGVACNCC